MCSHVPRAARSACTRASAHAPPRLCRTPACARSLAPRPPHATPRPAGTPTRRSFGAGSARPAPSAGRPRRVARGRGSRTPSEGSPWTRAPSPARASCHISASPEPPTAAAPRTPRPNEDVTHGSPPRVPTSTVSAPAPVSMAKRCSALPRKAATQRSPLPHISGSLPSALTTRIAAGSRSTKRTPSAPTPRRRSQMPATCARSCGAYAASTITKSFPRPCHFSKGTTPGSSLGSLIRRGCGVACVGRGPRGARSGRPSLCPRRAEPPPRAHGIGCRPGAGSGWRSARRRRGAPRSAVSAPSTLTFATSISTHSRSSGRRSLPVVSVAATRLSVLRAGHFRRGGGCHHGAAVHVGHARRNTAESPAAKLGRLPLRSGREERVEQRAVLPRNEEAALLSGLRQLARFELERIGRIANARRPRRRARAAC